MRLIPWETLETAAQQVCFITGLSISLCTCHGTPFLEPQGCSWSLSFVSGEQSSALQRFGGCMLLYWAKCRNRTDNKTGCLCGAVIGWLSSDELNYGRVTPLLPKLVSQPALFDQDIQVPNLPVLLLCSLPVIICRILITVASLGCINWMPSSLALYLKTLSTSSLYLNLLPEHTFLSHLPFLSVQPNKNVFTNLDILGNQSPPTPAFRKEPFWVPFSKLWFRLPEWLINRRLYFLILWGKTKSLSVMINEKSPIYLIRAFLEVLCPF